MLTGVEDNYNLEVTSRLARTKLAPLYFVRSGIIDLHNTSTLRYSGLNNDDWSSQAYLAEHAYYLEFSTVVTTSREHNRWHGFPLRCLSTVLDM